MPIIVKRDDILRRGGKYVPGGKPVLDRPAPAAPLAPPAPPPVDARVQTALTQLRAVLEQATAEQRRQATQLATLAGQLSQPQQAGDFTITITARDADGRISAVDIKRKP
jgi:hypothetical protein